MKQNLGVIVEPLLQWYEVNRRKFELGMCIFGIFLFQPQGPLIS